MTRLCLLVGILLLMAGCTAEDQQQWNEAMKDWRGDNQVFRGGSAHFSSDN